MCIRDSGTAVVQRRTQGRDGLRWLLDLMRCRVDAVRVDVEREQPAVAIENVAALRLEDDGIFLLFLRLFNEEVVLDDLEVDEPAFDRHSPGDTERGCDDNAPLQHSPPREINAVSHDSVPLPLRDDRLGRRRCCLLYTSPS